MANAIGSGFSWEQEVSLGTERELPVMAVTLECYSLLKLYADYLERKDL